jgi:hypothetical protein
MPADRANVKKTENEKFQLRHFRSASCRLLNCTHKKEKILQAWIIFFRSAGPAKSLSPRHLTCIRNSRNFYNIPATSRGSGESRSGVMKKTPLSLQKDKGGSTGPKTRRRLK